MKTISILAFSSVYHIIYFTLVKASSNRYYPLNYVLLTNEFYCYPEWVWTLPLVRHWLGLGWGWGKLSIKTHSSQFLGFPISDLMYWYTCFMHFLGGFSPGCQDSGMAWILRSYPKMTSRKIRQVFWNSSRVGHTMSNRITFPLCKTMVPFFSFTRCE